MTPQPRPCMAQMQQAIPPGIIRVFPRRTKASPDDAAAYFGPPDLFAEANEVHYALAEKRLLQMLEIGFTPHAMLWQPETPSAERWRPAPEWRRFQRLWARPAITHAMREERRKHEALVAEREGSGGKSGMSHMLRIRVNDEDAWSEMEEFATKRARDKAEMYARIIGGFRTHSYWESAKEKREREQRKAAQ